MDIRKSIKYIISKNLNTDDVSMKSGVPSDELNKARGEWAQNEDITMSKEYVTRVCNFINYERLAEEKVLEDNKSYIEFFQLLESKKHLFSSVSELASLLGIIPTTLYFHYRRQGNRVPLEILNKLKEL